jgi:trehalose/maltose hydrolase-like predicted phosphorylase
MIFSKIEGKIHIAAMAKGEIAIVSFFAGASTGGKREISDPVVAGGFKPITQ